LRRDSEAFHRRPKESPVKHSSTSHSDAEPGLPPASALQFLVTHLACMSFFRIVRETPALNKTS